MDWGKIVRQGLIGGVALSFIVAVGLFEAFANRMVIDPILTSGWVLVLWVPVVFGYRATRQVVPDGATVRAARPADIAAGAVTGAIAGAVLGLLVVITSAKPDVRDTLLALSPSLVQRLSFGHSVGYGFGVLTLGGAILGAIGGGIDLVPQVVRRVVSTVVVTILGFAFGELVVGDILRSLGLRSVDQFFYAQSRGLKPLGAVILAVVFVALRFLLKGKFKAIRERIPLGTGETEENRATRRNWFLVLGIIALAAGAWAPNLFGLYLNEVLSNVGLFILLGLGLNIVVGFAGLLDLGYVGFFAIGAYTMAVLTSPDLQLFQLSFWQALPFALLVALFAGVLLGLPVLRMRGDYLAITTLGFGEIIRLLALSDWLKPYLGGAQGVTRIARPTIGDFVFDTPQEFYYLILIGCLIAWVMAKRIKDSRLGRAWMAIREDEDVAQAMGINRVTAKLTAFALGALLGGLSGSIFAAMVNSVVPTSFGLLISINVVALIIIGGLGSLPGVLIGALVLVGLPELLREFNDYRLLVYGALLVVMMLFRPQGLWPEEAIERELAEAPALAEEQTAPLPAVPTSNTEV